MRIARIYNTLAYMNRRCAQFIFKEMKETLKEKGEVSLLLSGDISSQEMYRQLARLINQERRNLPLMDIYWFLVNEHWTSPGDTLSCENRLQDNLFDLIRPPKENVFEWPVLVMNPGACAQTYRKSLENHFISTKKKPDLLVLGMDTLGNTASLLQGMQVLQDNARLGPIDRKDPRLTFAVYDSLEQEWELTVSPALLNQSEKVIFFISGSERREAFKAHLSGTQDKSVGWIQGQKIYYYLTRDVAGDFIYQYRKG